jgi:hypothetical protein
MQQEVEAFLDSLKYLKCRDHSLPFAAICLSSNCHRFLLCSVCVKTPAHKCEEKYVKTVEAIKKYIMMDLNDEDKEKGEGKCRQKLQKILNLMKQKEQIRNAPVKVERKITVKAYDHPLIFEHHMTSTSTKKIEKKPFFGFWCH